MITSGILGIVLGFLTNVLPLGMKLINNKWELEKEITLKKLEFDLAKQNIELQAKNLAVNLELANTLAALREGESLRSHDTAISTDGVVGVIRALIRPVITFILFGFWLAVKIALLVHLMVAESIPFLTASEALLDPFTTGLVAAVMGFWFSDRTISKHADLSRRTADGVLPAAKK
jgi:hypothetical protein